MVSTINKGSGESELNREHVQAKTVKSKDNMCNQGMDVSTSVSDKVGVVNTTVLSVEMFDPLKQLLSDVMCIENSMASNLQETDSQSSKASIPNANSPQHAVSFRFKPGFLNKPSPPLKISTVTVMSSSSSKSNIHKDSPSTSAKEKNKAKPVSPYAHLVPPATYKPPPPVDEKEAFSYSPLSAIVTGHKEVKLPVTKSRKNHILNGLLINND